MFEKEAEERAKDYTENKERQVAYKCGFLDGADYNKANEWHNLRKNPNDLPDEGEIVLCYCLGYCGVCYPITARMYTNYEDSSIHYWWTLGGEGKSEKLDNVIKWKEIILPKGSE